MAEQIKQKKSIEQPIRQNYNDFSDIDEVKQELTRKQIKFAERYSRTLNGSQSAIYAGYSPKSAGTYACLFLKDKKVNKYINYLLYQQRMQGNISKQDIIRQCTQIIQNYRSSTAKIAALNLIAKLTGLAEKPIFGDNNQITINIKKKDDN